MERWPVAKVTVTEELKITDLILLLTSTHGLRYLLRYMHVLRIMQNAKWRIMQSAVCRQNVYHVKIWIHILPSSMRLRIQGVVTVCFTLSMVAVFMLYSNQVAGGSITNLLRLSPVLSNEYRENLGWLNCKGRGNLWSRMCPLDNTRAPSLHMNHQ